MSHHTPPSRIFAECLIGHEAQLNPPPQDEMPTALPVIEKLRPLLATLMGRAGYHGLILRALVLSRQEVAWLCDVEISADGSVQNFAEHSAGQDAAEATRGSEVLLAGLIRLLVAFIGEILTLRLVHELWPVVLDDADFTQDYSHEQST